VVEVSCRKQNVFTLMRIRYMTTCLTSSGSFTSKQLTKVPPIQSENIILLSHPNLCLHVVIPKPGQPSSLKFLQQGSKKKFCSFFIVQEFFFTVGLFSERCQLVNLLIRAISRVNSNANGTKMKKNEAVRKISALGTITRSLVCKGTQPTQTLKNAIFDSLERIIRTRTR
jgi:hypothetical protein